MYNYLCERAQVLSHNHPLIVIFIAAVFVRLVNMGNIFVGDGTFVVEDDFYIQMATEWAQQLGFMDGLPNNESFRERMPLFPLLIALLSLLKMANPLGIVCVNCIIDSCTCVVVGKIGCRVNKRVGLLAGMLAAVWPNLIIHSALVLGDTLFVCLFTGMLFWSIEYLEQPKKLTALFGGLFLGLAILTRPVALFLAPAMLVACFAIALYQNISPRRAIFLALMFIMPVAITIGPLLVYNKINFNSAVLSAQTGTHLANWVVPPVKKIESGVSISDAKTGMSKKYSAELNRLKVINPNIFEQSKILTSLALRELSEVSVASITQAWLQGMAINLVVPAILVDNRIRKLSTQSFYHLEAPNFITKVLLYVQGNGSIYLILFILGVLGSVITLILSLYGLFLVWSRFPWAAIFVMFAVLYFLLINGPVASPKYRLPMEPIMIICASLSLVRVWKKVMPFNNTYE